MAKADRSTQFFEHLKLRMPDVTLVNDVGLCWPSLAPEDQWHERALSAHMPRHVARFSINSHEITSEKVQWGGTGIILMGEARPRLFQKMGSDPTNLGRWTWAKIQGRNGHFLRVVSAYQPVKNTSETGSSYQQQLRYFREQGVYECPRTLFVRDLKHQIQEWLQEGDHIIVGLDANDDIRKSPVRKMLVDQGLKESVLSINAPSVPPETNYKNNKGVPIDGIFVTPGIKPTRGGYSAYNEFMDSDHRTLWLDVPFTSALGFNPPNLHQHKMRAVKAGDPRSVECYNGWVRKGMLKEDNKVFKNLHLLKKLKIDQAPLEEIISIHASILSDSNRHKIWASNRAKKSFFGKYAWSPEWKAIKMPVLMWKMVQKRFTGNVKPKFLQ